MTKKLISLIIILSFIFSTSSISYTENTYSVPENPKELLTDSENDSEKSSFDISSSDIINNVSGKENAPAEILFEDASLRDINQKHFRLNNGSNLAIIYSVPVHYKDECGEWKDINGLSGLEKTEDADGNGISQRSMVSGKLQIPNESTDNTLYSLFDDDVAISMKYIAQTDNVGESVLIPKISQIIDEENDDLTKIKIDRDVVTYESIEQDVDIEYLIDPYCIKENIVLKKAMVNCGFIFEIGLSGLEVVEREDGSIRLYCKDTLKYTIPAPYMFDAEGSFSNSVKYSVEKIDGGIRLIVSADSEWIHSPDRAFPVTIDPEIDVALNETTLIDAGISDQFPNTNYSSTTFFNVSHLMEPENYRTRYLLGWDELPFMREYNNIVSARVRVRTSDSANSSGDHILVKAITSTWNSGTVTWNTKPSVSSAVLDAYACQSSSGYGWHEYDVTNAIMEAYESTPACFGLEFSLRSESSTVSSDRFVRFRTVTSAYSPEIIIEYRNQMGLEEDFSISTIDMGNAGKAYINNYNGNLTVVRDDFISDSNVMPFKISHVFNSGWSDVNFSGDNASFINTSAYTGMKVGRGWKLNVQQTVVPASAAEYDFNNNYSYIYNDADGTDHYFYLDQSTGKYVDEDGLRLTLEVDTANNRYIITDIEGNSKGFKIINETRLGVTYANGYIIYESNKYGQSVVYTYDTADNTRLKKVNDPSGLEAVFSYDSENYLSSISIGNYVITYQYGVVYGNTGAHNSGVLLSISENSVVKAEYNISLTTVCDSVRDLDYSYTYEYINYFKRVISKADWEIVSGHSNSAAFEYCDSYKSVVHYYGFDATNNTSDDYYITYEFDRYGNPVLVYTENSSRTGILRTNIANRDEDSNPLSLTGQNLNYGDIAEFGQIPNNLIKYGGFDNGSNFSFSTVNTSICSSAKSDEAKHDGKYSLKITRSVFTEAFAGISSNLGTVPAGSYTLSAYVKCPNDMTGKVIVKVSASSDLTSPIAQQEYMSVTNQSVDGGWERISLNFTNSTSRTLYLGIGTENAIGIMFIDSIQLEHQSDYSPLNYNMLTNTGFENSSWSWTCSNLNYVTLPSSDDAFEGVKSVKLTGRINGQAYFYQTIYHTDDLNASLILSGWGKADSLHNTELSSFFGLYADVCYTVGSSTTEYHLRTDIPFRSYSNDWQYISGVIRMPSGNNVTIKNIKVGGAYNYNSNIAYFDNLSLVQGSATYGDYDEDGNLITTVTNGLDFIRFEDYVNGKPTVVRNTSGDIVREYDYEAGEEIPITDGNGNTIGYQCYNEFGDPEYTGKVTDSGTYYTDYYYDSLHNNTAIEQQSFGNKCYYPFVYEYNQSTTNLTSSADELGNTVIYRYLYPTNVGNSRFWPTQMQDENGNYFNYDYNTDGSINRVYMVSTQNGSYNALLPHASFEYNTNGVLTGFLTPTTTYFIDYLNRYLPTQLGIGSGSNKTALVTFNYNPAYTQMTGYTLANNFTKSLQYDLTGNLSSIWYNNVAKAQFAYDANNNLVLAKDAQHNITREYTYGSDDRLLAYDLSSSKYQLNAYSTFDLPSDNIIDTVKHNEISFLGNDSIDIVYRTRTNRDTGESEYRIDNFLTSKSSTDTHDRIEKNEYLTINNTTLFKYVYGYTAPTSYHSDAISNQVSSVTTTVNNSSEVAKYEYDAIGRVTAIKDASNSIVERYQYDQMGQLIRNDSAAQNKTITYSYDISGNITSIKEYSYTLNSNLSNPTSVRNYSYVSSGAWKDKLNVYPGSATNILYDAIGNINETPNFQMSWIGNELASCTGLSSNVPDTIEYDYDFDGHVVYKKVTTNNTIREYYYVYEGDRLVAMAIDEGLGFTPTSIVYYLYDSDGSPIGFKRGGGTRYYFVKNLSGDVVKLIKQDGTVILTYQYDAWGKEVSHTGTSSNYNTLDKFVVFKYHSYMYDKDSGFYYINNRYYDPSICRFISANVFNIGQETGLGLNLYAFSSNDPINTQYVLFTANLYYPTQCESCVYSLEHSILLLMKRDDDPALGEDRARSMVNEVTGATYTTVPLQSIDFIKYWAGITAESVIINCHGSPGGLSYEDTTTEEQKSFFSVSDSEKLKKNNNIYVLALISCGTAGTPNKPGMNVAEVLSSKINDLGITIATNGISNSYRYCSFNDSGDDWRVYMNGSYVDNFGGSINDKGFYQISFASIIIYAKEHFRW